ncbi:hypothetical protein ACTXT7_002882 [Hymenolepis weldensis]
MDGGAQAKIRILALNSSALAKIQKPISKVWILKRQVLLRQPETLISYVLTICPNKLTVLTETTTAEISETEVIPGFDQKSLQLTVKDSADSLPNKQSLRFTINPYDFIKTMESLCNLRGFGSKTLEFCRKKPVPVYGLSTVVYRKVDKNKLKCIQNTARRMMLDLYSRRQMSVKAPAGKVPLINVAAALFGQWLFDEVINRMGGLLESDYFGLRYLDKSKQRQWLDPSKTVYKQLKNVVPRSLNFRVKHYPAKPLEELKQEKSRYFLYLQLRRDLHSGRLIGRNNDMHILAAHILQANLLPVN